MGAHRSGMLGHLAADQRAAGLPASVGDARDQLLDLVRVESPDRDVVEEPQWLGALARDVVDAHRDEVDADGVVAASGRRDHRLRADAVGGRDEHRIVVLPRLEREERTEPADATEHLGTCRRRHMALDATHCFLARIDVDAGGPVVERAHQAGVDAGAGSSSTLFDSVTGTGTG